MDREGNELKVGSICEVDCMWDAGMIKRHGECPYPHVAEIIEDKYFGGLIFTPRQHYSVKDSIHILKVGNVK